MVVFQFCTNVAHDEMSTRFIPQNVELNKLSIKTVVIHEANSYTTSVDIFILIDFSS